MKSEPNNIGALFSQYSSLDAAKEVKVKLLSAKRVNQQEDKVKEREELLKESQKDLKEAKTANKTAATKLNSKMEQMEKILHKIKGKLLETEENSSGILISEQTLESHFTCQICSQMPSESNSMRIICTNGHNCCKNCLERMKNGCHLCRKKLLDIEDRNTNNLIQEIRKKQEKPGETLKRQ